MRFRNRKSRKENAAPEEIMLIMQMPTEGEEWEPDTLSLESPHLYDSEWAVLLFCDILEWSQKLRASIEEWPECLLK